MVEQKCAGTWQGIWKGIWKAKEFGKGGQEREDQDECKKRIRERKNADRIREIKMNADQEEFQRGGKGREGIWGGNVSKGRGSEVVLKSKWPHWLKQVLWQLQSVFLFSACLSRW